MCIPTLWSWYLHHCSLTAERKQQLKQKQTQHFKTKLRFNLCPKQKKTPNFVTFCIHYIILKTLCLKRLWSIMCKKGYLDLNFHEGLQEIFSEDPTCLSVDNIWWKHDRSYKETDGRTFRNAQKSTETLE